MYDWLKDYQKINDEIAYLEFNLEKTERELSRWQKGDLAKVKLVRGSKGANVEEVLEHIKEELAYKEKQRYEIVELVRKFKGLENDILRLKYIDGLTLDEIAEELNYSTGHIKRKHAELMRLIKFVDEHGII